MINSKQRERFQRALDKTITLDERIRTGIGMQKEKTTHAVLKNYLDPDVSHQEIPVGNFIADIKCADVITEIQTRQFGYMREKLSFFLPLYQVNIVHPIIYDKYITWIDADTGKPIRRNHSTRRGCFYQAFDELYAIRPFLKNPHLKITLLLINAEEYRIADGWSRDKKRGSHRFDTLPTQLVDECILSRPEDYRIFLPEDLPQQFTSHDLAESVGRRSLSYSKILLILTELGVTKRIGRKGRAYLYQTAENESPLNNHTPT